MFANRAFSLVTVVLALAGILTACAVQAGADFGPASAIPGQQDASASSGSPASEPTQGAKTDPGVLSTPGPNEGPGVEATPVAAPPVTATPAASPAATPATGQWADWKGKGYVFRYPQACRVIEADQSLAIGSGIGLEVMDGAGLSLADFVDQLMEKKAQTAGWTLESRQASQVGGNWAEHVEYRFGGTNRYGTAYFIQGKGKIYAWQLTAGGSTCGEASAFGDIVASFRVVQ